MKLLDVNKNIFMEIIIVLVPADVETTVKSLSRFTSETATIKATLKRKLSYKHHVYSVNVRMCAQLLSEKTLYKDHIKFNSEWELTSTSEQELISQPNKTDSPSQSSELKNAQNTTDIYQCKTQDALTLEDDGWSEIDEDELMSGMSDTILSAKDFIETNERDLIYNFTPGEGNIPVSVFLQKMHSKELTFPKIFCGERHSDKIPLIFVY